MSSSSNNSSFHLLLILFSSGLFTPLMILKAACTHCPGYVDHLLTLFVRCFHKLVKEQVQSSQSGQTNSESNPGTCWHDHLILKTFVALQVWLSRSDCMWAHHHMLGFDQAPCRGDERRNPPYFHSCRARADCWKSDGGQVNMDGGPNFGRMAQGTITRWFN